MDLETALRELASELTAQVSTDLLVEFLDLVDAGEYGVALEWLCDGLSDAEQAMSRNDVMRIWVLADKMKLNRPSIDDMAELIVDD